jgi:pantoate--beta-alanine ligase
MQVLTTLDTLRTQVGAWHHAGQKVALVPTMGNLHDGHIDLVTRARMQADKVVVSVFVNPLQFGKNEDFNRYPRTLEADADRLRKAGADVLFAPTVAEVYPHGIEVQTRIEVPGLSDILCGLFRPGHFSGVATVVNMLFNMVQPDTALFGEKDYQQLSVIRQMVRDLHMPVTIIGVPTVRDDNGLALSSRNQYLSTDERVHAGLIYKTLKTTAAQLRAGQRDYLALQAQAQSSLREAGFRPDYYQIMSPLLTPPQPDSQDFVILVAAWLGKARLLDNLRVQL